MSLSISSDPVVSIKDAGIYQDDKPILLDLNFQIEKGEFVFLIGKTGSGKSSLLKTLYADLPLRLGEITVAGHDLHKIKRNEVPFLRRKLGIIFQDFQLFYDRTVAENLFFVMRATGWKEKSKMKDRLAQILMMVGLGAVGNKMPHQLSGGEQQRVVVARALINEPILLIADEPTGNLDPDIAKGIFNLFLDINNSGATVLMATHNHNLVKNHPARILKCEDGKLLDSKKETFSLSGYY
jgi:cell division transport system ATP-binding protein